MFRTEKNKKFFSILLIVVGAEFGDFREKQEQAVHIQKDNQLIRDRKQRQRNSEYIKDTSKILDILRFSFQIWKLFNITEQIKHLRFS